MTPSPLCETSKKADVFIQEDVLYLEVKMIEAQHWISEGKVTENIRVCLDFFHGMPDVRNEALVQHAVHLVQDEELEVAKSDMASLGKIEEPARSRHQDVATPPRLTCLQP